MDIGALIPIALEAGTEQRLNESLALKPGDRLVLKVLEVQADNQVLVDFGRFRALAEISFPVIPGEALTVKVIDTAGRLHLALVQHATAGSPAATGSAPVGAFAGAALAELASRLDGLLQMLQELPEGQAAALETTQALAGLKAQLDPLAVGAGGEQTAARLRDWCENCGLFFEPRLAAEWMHAPEAAEPHSLMRLFSGDLKLRLAQVKALLDAPAALPQLLAAPETAALSSAVEALLKDIHRGQQNAAAQQRGDELFQVIHFFLPLQDPRRKARLKIAYPKTGRRRAGDGFRATLLLDLDRLGQTRIDLLLLERSLALTFFMSTEGGRRALEEHMDELNSALTPFFDSLRVKTAVSAKRIAEFETEDLTPVDARRLDVRA